MYLELGTLSAFVSRYSHLTTAFGWYFLVLCRTFMSPMLVGIVAVMSPSPRTRTRAWENVSRKGACVKQHYR